VKLCFTARIFVRLSFRANKEQHSLKFNRTVMPYNCFKLQGTRNNVVLVNVLFYELHNDHWFVYKCFSQGIFYSILERCFTVNMTSYIPLIGLYQGQQRSTTVTGFLIIHKFKIILGIWTPQGTDENNNVSIGEFDARGENYDVLVLPMYQSEVTIYSISSKVADHFLRNQTT
jgi:hypothetical protein